MTTKKYRPSLTSTQISILIELCKAQSPMSPEVREIIGILAPYYTKIQVGAITSSHTTTRRSPIDLLIDLGEDNAPSQPNLNRAVYWQQCYEKLQAQTKDNLTPSELESAYEHMYLHNLFSDEEKSLFEQGKL